MVLAMLAIFVLVIMMAFMTICADHCDGDIDDKGGVDHDAADRGNDAVDAGVHDNVDVSVMIVLTMVMVMMIMFKMMFAISVIIM